MLMLRRRPVTAQSHGFKAWECVKWINPAPLGTISNLLVRRALEHLWLARKDRRHISDGGAMFTKAARA